MKKISVFLVVNLVIFCLSSALFPVAAVGYEDETVMPYNRESHVEYGKLFNNLCYFEDNPEYTLSSIIYDTGIVDTSIHFKNEPDTIYSYQTSIVNGQHWRSRSKELFAQIKDQVINKKIELNKTNIESSPRYSIGIQSLSVYDAAVARYGTEYTSKYLGQGTESGATARLYESKGYEINHFLYRWLTIENTINDVSVATGFPVWMVEAIAVYHMVDTIFKLKYNTGFDVYEFDMHFQKRVEVNHYYVTHISLKRMHYNGCVGDPEFDPIFKYISTPLKYYDYDYHIQLIDTGLYNYLNGIY